MSFGGPPNVSGGLLHGDPLGYGITYLGTFTTIQNFSCQNATPNNPSGGSPIVGDAVDGSPVIDGTVGGSNIGSNGGGNNNSKWHDEWLQWVLWLQWLNRGGGKTGNGNGNGGNGNGNGNGGNGNGGNGNGNGNGGNGNGNGNGGGTGGFHGITAIGGSAGGNTTGGYASGMGGGDDTGGPWGGDYFPPPVPGPDADWGRCISINGPPDQLYLLPVTCQETGVTVYPQDCDFMPFYCFYEGTYTFTTKNRSARTCVGDAQALTDPGSVSAESRPNYPTLCLYPAIIPVSYTYAP